MAADDGPCLVRGLRTQVDRCLDAGVMALGAHALFGCALDFARAIKRDCARVRIVDALGGQHGQAAQARAAGAGPLAALDIIVSTFGDAVEHAEDTGDLSVRPRPAGVAPPTPFPASHTPALPRPLLQLAPAGGVRAGEGSAGTCGMLGPGAGGGWVIQTMVTVVYCTTPAWAASTAA